MLKTGQRYPFDIVSARVILFTLRWKKLSSLGNADKLSPSMYLIRIGMTMTPNRGMYLIEMSDMLVKSTVKTISVKYGFLLEYAKTINERRRRYLKG